MKLSESLLFENARKTFQSNLVLLVVLVIEFKGLSYFRETTRSQSSPFAR